MICMIARKSELFSSLIPFVGCVTLSYEPVFPISAEGGWIVPMKGKDAWCLKYKYKCSACRNSCKAGKADW